MKQSALLGIASIFFPIILVHAEVKYDRAIPQLTFAAERLESALSRTETNVLLEIETDPSRPESFAIIQPDSDTIRVIGTDAAGAMYGGLELAEMLEIGDVRPVEQTPDMDMRGIKFNIPLDVRTPSYTDMGDAGQFNLPHVWDFDFWKAFIDEAANHRYNYISLWNLHPFPSLVKIPDYPDIALENVKRAVDLEKKYYDGRGRDFDAPEILDHTETVLEISIDEKIDFWRRVMRYGKSRNIDFYFITWNVFDYGVEGKYGLDDSMNNPTTTDYFRKSVAQLFLTYPDLKGIGITTGENMHDATDQEKEDWMFSTYGLAVLDVLEQQPDREITFLHRQHEAGASAIADTFQPLIDHPKVDFIFSYKYAKAHAYSSTKQPFYTSFAKEISERSDDLKTIWTMRNDSTYLFRWAAPSFLREYVQNIPMHLTRGYYFGSDGWVWGRDFISKDPEDRGRLELEKHWLQWLLWGRLAYDSTLSDERIIGIVQTRFPGVEAAKLLDHWQSASMVFPIISGFHWGDLDYRWYPEACLGVPNFAKNKNGFHDVNRFITLRTHPSQDYISIPRHFDALQSGDMIAGKTPIDASNQLLENADRVLSYVNELDPKDDRELTATLADMKSMALLSRYYGLKIKAAAELYLFRETEEPKHQTESVDLLTEASLVWRAYATTIDARYIQPIWMGRIRSGPIDFHAITTWVDEDIEIAKGNIETIED